MSHTRTRPALTLIRLLALAAWIISATLWYTGNTHTTAPGCAADAGCAQALQSHWAHVAGVPITAPAMLTHALILVLSLATHNRAGLRAMRTLVFAAALVAVWFLALQAYEGAWCPWCCAAHACALLMVPLSMRVQPDITVAMREALVPMLCAGALAGVFIAVQLTQSQRAVEPLPFAGFTDLRAEDYPLLGRADAPLLIGVLYDPLCPHCRSTHPHLLRAIERFEDRLAVALLPVPFSDRCNPHMSRTPPGFEDSCALVTLQLAVWVADASQSSAFDAFLFHDATARPALAQARAVAEQLVGVDALDAATRDARLVRALRRNTDVFDLLGRGVPRLLLAGKAYPVPEQENDLIQLLELAFAADAAVSPSQ